MNIDKYVLRDIQFLLIKYEGYIDDTGTLSSAWEDKTFSMLCSEYGFNKENLYKGFEDLTC